MPSVLRCIGTMCGILFYVAIIILKNWVRRFLAEQLVREEQKFDVVLALEVS